MNWALGVTVLVILLIIVAVVRFVLALLQLLHDCDKDGSW